MTSVAEPKTTRTPKRLAAAILRADMEIVTDYWAERHPDLEDAAEQIQVAIDRIIEPFLDRLEVIAKGVTVYGNER